MKRTQTILHIDGTDSYLDIELENCSDYHLIGIKQRDDGVDVTLSEQVVSKGDLLNLRDAIDYIVKTNKQLRSDNKWK